MELDKRNVIFVSTFICTCILFILLSFTIGGYDTEVKKNPNNYWSAENVPIFYGASKISIPKGETFDIKDARFRVFARDFEDGEMTLKIELVSNNVDVTTDGTYEVVYTTTDSHGNKVDFTQTVIVETGRTKINVERVVYTLPSADHLHKIGVYRADAQDRQILGIYLSKDATAQMRSIDADMDMYVQYYSNDSWREGSTTKIPKSGEWVTLKNEYKKINPETRTAYNPVVLESANSVPLLQTIMLNDSNNSLTKTFKVEVEYNLIDYTNRSNNGEVRRLKFYYYKDDYDAFRADWNVPASDYNKTRNQVASDLTSYDESVIYDQFAVVDSYRYMVVADSWCYNKLAAYGGNWFDTLEHHLEYYNKLINRYDEMFGLSKNPENTYDQNVESKNVAKPNAHGAGAAYYGTNHIGVNFPSDFTIFERNWGGLHETGHGYQGPFGNGSQMNLGETSNNVFAVYVQRDKTIYQADNTWLGPMTDREEEANTFRLTEGGWPSSSHLNWRLYILMNLFDSLEGPDTYAKMYSWYRNQVINNGYKRENHDAYVESLADIYGINIIPYMEAWGITITDSVKGDIYGRNLKLYNILGDTIHDDNLSTFMTDNDIELKYTLIDNSTLKKSEIKADLTVNIDIDDISKVIGKRIILKDGNDTIRNVEITSSSVTLSSVPVGTYYLQMPVLDYYSSEQTYVEVTDLTNVVSVVYTNSQEIDFNDYLTLNVIGTNNTNGYTLKFSDNYKKGTITLGLAVMGNNTYYVKIYNGDTLLSSEYSDYLHTDNKYYFHFETVGGVKAKTYEVNLEPGYVIQVYRSDPINKVTLTNSAGERMTQYNMTGSTTRYVVMDNGIKLESMTDEEANAASYAVLKNNLTNTIDTYLDSVSEEEITDRTKNSTTKAKVLSAYNQLKNEDKEPYDKFMKLLLRGGSPIITYKGETTYNKDSNVDLISLITAFDNEDSNMYISSKNTVVESNLDLNTNGEYEVKYTVTDSDGNSTLLTVYLTVNNEETTNPSISPKTDDETTTKKKTTKKATTKTTTTTTSEVSEETTTTSEITETSTKITGKEEIDVQKKEKETSDGLPTIAKVFIVIEATVVLAAIVYYVFKALTK